MLPRPTVPETALRQRLEVGDLAGVVVAAVPAADQRDAVAEAAHLDAPGRQTVKTTAGQHQPAHDEREGGPDDGDLVEDGRHQHVGDRREDGVDAALEVGHEAGLDGGLGEHGGVHEARLPAGRAAGNVMSQTCHTADGRSTPVSATDQSHSRSACSGSTACASTPRTRAVGPGSVRCRDVDVLAVDAAEPLELRAGRGPDGGGGALLGRLEALVRRPVLADPAGRDHLLARQVALQRGEDAARVDGERAHAGRGPRARRGARRTGCWRSWPARRPATCRSRW